MTERKSLFFERSEAAAFHLWSVSSPSAFICSQMSLSQPQVVSGASLGSLWFIAPSDALALEWGYFPGRTALLMVMSNVLAGSAISVKAAQ